LRVTHDFVEGDLKTLRGIMELKGADKPDSGSTRVVRPDAKMEYLPV
jgi:hypothetical protein